MSAEECTCHTKSGVHAAVCPADGFFESVLHGEPDGEAARDRADRIAPEVTP